MWRFKIVATLLSIAAHASAVPVSNTTSAAPTSEPSWVSEPSGRGSFSLIFNSLITLAMCVWTCLHVNVTPGTTGLQRVFHKLTFLAMGVFGPEAVLYLAIAQFLEAKGFREMWCPRLCPGVGNDRGLGSAAVAGRNINPVDGQSSTQSVHRVGPDDTEISARAGCDQGSASAELGDATGCDRDRIGMEEAFFVCMGGFSIGPSRGSNYFTSTLTPKGFLELTQRGIIGKDLIDKRQILDKGKADMLAKLLVCIQACWMIIQVLARKASGLPVTILELHVLMHVLCTIAIYGFWLDKPLDVTEPMKVVAKNPDLGDLLAVIGSGGPLRVRFHSPVTDVKGNTPVADATEPLEPVTAGVGRLHITSDDGTSAEVSGVPKRICFVGPDPFYKRLAGTFCLGRLQCRDPEGMNLDEEAVIHVGESLIIGDVLTITNEGYHNGVLTLGLVDIATLFSVAATLHGGKYRSLLRDDWFRGVAKPRLISADSRTHMGTHTFVAISLILPVIYGGCHSSAWNTHFPTPTERLLWRVSSILIGSVPFVLAGYPMLIKLMNMSTGKLHWLRWLGCIFPWDIGGYGWNSGTPAIAVIKMTILSAAICALFFARVFVVLESFLSLRSLPVGSFATTPWDQYWPHF